MRVLRCSTARLAVLLLSVLSLPASGEELKGKVVLVSEGDTLTIEVHEPVTVRVEGIDCPEPGQPFFDKARQLTASLVLGKIVQATTMGKDSDGRTRARVCVGTRCLDAELLRAGLAWHDRQRDQSQALAQLEAAARAAKRGLWSDPRPTPPWTWRSTHKLPPLKGTLVGEARGTAAIDVTHPVCVHLGARIAHWFTCPQARGLNCRFVRADQARSFGFKLHSCLVDRPPPAPPSADRACARDSDCTFAPRSGCGCPPCGEIWRRPANRKHAEWLARQYSIESCPTVKLKCAKCSSPVRWLGTRVVCVRGQCEVR